MIVCMSATNNDISTTISHIKGTIPLKYGVCLGNCRGFSFVVAINSGNFFTFKIYNCGVNINCLLTLGFECKDKKIR